MQLPKLDVPITKIHLPISNKTIEVRPFLVKEEKILLMAAESSDLKTKFNAIKQIVNNCIITPIDLNQLPSPELDYIFIKLRSISVNNKAVVTVTVDSKKHEVVVDLSNLQLDISTLKDKKIQLTPDLGVVMKIPTVQTIEPYLGADLNPDTLIKYVSDHIDYAYDDKQMYPFNEAPADEIFSFMDSLTESQFSLMREYLNSIPTAHLDIEYETKDGLTKTRVTDLQNFF